MFETISYQLRQYQWTLECFGEKVAADPVERRNRFGEEAVELMQACGASKEDVLMLVEYVFNRPPGTPVDEVGGVMNTLSALCTAKSINLDWAAERGLAKAWQHIDKIRIKHANKPRVGPLPIKLDLRDPRPSTGSPQGGEPGIPIDAVDYTTDVLK